MVESFVFAVSAVVIIAGAVGVLVNRNPVHAALSLAATLFGVAVLFVALEANFLAAVQVIVYAGAIVVLFLFVIMLLGVDEAEDIAVEPLIGQRPAGIALGVITVIGLTGVVLTSSLTGAPAGHEWVRDGADVAQIGRLLFTDYVFALEITSLLLLVAVVGAVALARTTRGEAVDLDEPVPSLPGDPIVDDVEEEVE